MPSAMATNNNRNVKNHICYVRKTRFLVFPDHVRMSHSFPWGPIRPPSIYTQPPRDISQLSIYTRPPRGIAVSSFWHSQTDSKKVYYLLLRRIRIKRCVVDLMMFRILCVSIRFEDGSESEGDIVQQKKPSRLIVLSKKFIKLRLH